MLKEGALDWAHAAHGLSLDSINPKCLFCLLYIYICEEELFQEPTAQKGLEQKHCSLSWGLRTLWDRKSKKSKAWPFRLVAATWLLNFFTVLVTCKRESRKGAAPDYEFDASKHHVLPVDHKRKGSRENLGCDTSLFLYPSLGRWSWSLQIQSWKPFNSSLSPRDVVLADEQSSAFRL